MMRIVGSLLSIFARGRSVMPQSLVMIGVLVFAVLVAGGIYLMTDHSSTPSPGVVLNLSAWKLQLPVEAGQSGQIEEVKWPALRSYSSWYFQVNAAGDGVVFRATAGGKTTPGGLFARSALRQMMDGGTPPAAPSSAGSSWSMTIRAGSTHLAPGPPAIGA